MREIKNGYRISVGKSETKMPFGILWYGWSIM
jgi:hypothetical protein